MRYALPAALLLATAPLLPAQEREVPRDSTRITIPGCARGRTFIIAARDGHDPVSRELQPGRRFRLAGKREILDDIRKREGTMVEVTGLVRKADLAGPGGINVGGVRIGGGPPREPLGSAPGRGLTGVAPDAVLDVEGWNLLAESCPSR